MIIIANDRDFRVNEQLPGHISCRLIDADGLQVGIMGVNTALEMAYDAGLDLVEIAPDADPPVCRIMDYGKYRYEQQKKEKAIKKGSKQSAIKEMKFRCRIGEGDYNTKKKHIERFLDAGSKVKVTIMFRGREMSHPDIGMELLEKLTDDLEGKCSVVQAPRLEGRNMTMVVAPL